MKKAVMTIYLLFAVFIAMVIFGVIFDNAWLIIGSVFPLFGALLIVFHNRYFRR